MSNTTMLAAQINHLVGRNNKLQADNQRLKDAVSDIIENGHNNGDEQDTIYFVEQSTLYDIIEKAAKLQKGGSDE